MQNAPSLKEEFVIFWASYPRRTGKLAAQQAYRKARTLASAQDILDGIERYKHSKPAYADWCHPRTFLAQGRWMDEPDTDTNVKPELTCLHDPPCAAPGRWACQQKTESEAYKASQKRAAS